MAGVIQRLTLRSIAQKACYNILCSETGIGNTEYNNVNTFYAGYITAQIPGHYLMQRFPLGKFVSLSILLCGSPYLFVSIIFLHCTATSYGALIPLRVLPGFFESVLVPSMEVTMSMFFTPAESIRLQPIFWISCPAAPIPAGFIAYGLLRVSHPTILPWKFFMIIMGGITFFIAMGSWFWYPDNPAKARFLTLEERVQAIRRVHAATRSAIEQKTFKRYQLVEALRDPVSWLFFSAALFLMLSNNLVFQQSLLFVSIGVSRLGSTLVSAAGGSFSIVCSVLGTLGFLWCLPAIEGGIGMVALPWDATLSLLACMLLAGSTFGATYIIALGIANFVSPQIWVARDAPRYYGAWIAQIIISWVAAPACMLAVHWILTRKNTERRAWIAVQEEAGHRPAGLVEQVDEHGDIVKVEVDISLLDLTDLENKCLISQL
ncbi:major facilitator superfamily domain-containing protein [Pseudomassariella vexata]|uniref:Major facilitator superfamily domain-containing protein n=1 Tax=Pseudomassariella vexata TaxID=1141098 RepID=A0A1Y2DNV1_9PEZI|nr:major facilitator superfamily domain-containing protein [Pseudomassariella vexata]ORY60816.1 major facilitator superfamily domain-containing protein [Pseudomassariella vexata]